MNLQLTIAPGDVARITVAATANVTAMAVTMYLLNGVGQTPPTLSYATQGSSSASLPQSTFEARFTVSSGFAAGDVISLAGTYTDASGTYPWACAAFKLANSGFVSTTADVNAARDLVRGDISTLSTAVLARLPVNTPTLLGYLGGPVMLAASYVAPDNASAVDAKTAAEAANNKLTTDRLNKIEGSAQETQATANKTAILDALDGISGGTAGPGADAVTLRISVGGNTVADADVWITSDAAGSNTVAGTKQTNSAGTVSFLLDAGTQYYLWMQKDGVNSIRGELFTAVAD